MEKLKIKEAIVVEGTGRKVFIEMEYPTKKALLMK